MKIIVHLHSTLQVQTDDGPKRTLELDLEKVEIVKDLVEALNLDVDHDHLLIAINGEIAKLVDPVHDGDHVHLMLPISGG